MVARLKTWCRFTAFMTMNGLVLGGIYFFVIGPCLELLSDQQALIEKRTQTLEQVKSVIARNRLIASIDPGQIEAASSRFLQGDSESLLSANLLKRLRQIAEAKGVSLSSVAMLPAREWFDRRLVGTRVEFSGSTQDVAGVLSAIEHGASLFFINHAKLSQVKGTDDGAADDAVAVTIEVYGATQWPEG
jgi:hypothetical protein